MCVCTLHTILILLNIADLTTFYFYIEPVVGKLSFAVIPFCLEKKKRSILETTINVIGEIRHKIIEKYVATSVSFRKPTLGDIGLLNC